MSKKNNIYYILFTKQQKVHSHPVKHRVSYRVIRFLRGKKNAIFRHNHYRRRHYWNVNSA